MKTYPYAKALFLIALSSTLACFEEARGSESPRSSANANAGESCADQENCTPVEPSEPAVAVNDNPVPGAVPPAITLHMLMVLKTKAHVTGNRTGTPQGEANLDTAEHVASRELLDATREAFLKTWPELMLEITNGKVQIKTAVIESNVPVTTAGYLNDLIEPEDAPDWGKPLPPKGLFDIIFVASPRPQKAMWARGIVDGTSGWISVALRKDLGKYEDCLAGWTHESLHILGESFYRNVHGLKDIPDVHGGEEAGYTREQAPYKNWLTWYRDYYNGTVPLEGRSWGLGDRAWSLGTIRQWAVRPGQTP